MTPHLRHVSFKPNWPWFKCCVQCHTDVKSNLTTSQCFVLYFPKLSLAYLSVLHLIKFKT